MTDIDEPQQEKILELLQAEEVRHDHLDLGCSLYHEVWWYGFILGGREAIILSDGRILRNTAEMVRLRNESRQIGENEISQILSYKTSLGDIAPLISRKTVERYYTTPRTEKLINPVEVYNQVRDRFLYYMDFSGQDEVADVLTCWIIATYCYPLFYWFPHVLINAPSGSGKSKCLSIIRQLSFRGFDIGASAGVTPAQLFRTLEGNRGCIIIDEYEQVDNDTTKLVNQILNASASKDAYVIRSEQIDKQWKAWKFPIFCPKAVGNIAGINPTSLSRFIAFKWLKTTSEKGKRKPEREADKKTFEPIRESLYLLILENFNKIKEIYDSIDLPPELKNRDEDNWSPLFAVARFIDFFGDVSAEKGLKKYLSSYSEVEIETQDNTEEFFLLLHDKLPEEERYYTPKEIAEITEIGELLSYLKSPPHWIGRKLKLYQFKQVRIHGTRQYLLSKASIKQVVLERYYTNTMTPNDTNDTQYNKRNLTIPDGVSLGVLGIVSPEGMRDTMCHFCPTPAVVIAKLKDEFKPGTVLQRPLCESCLNEARKRGALIDQGCQTTI